MNTVKRHAWPRLVAGTALVAGLSMVAGVFPQPWGASSSEVSQRSAAVPLDVKDATVSTLGNSKETPLAASASQRPAGPRDARTLPGERAAIDPARELKKLSVSLGGCLRAYGSAGQCLPVVPPSAAEHVRDMVDAGVNPKSMSHPWTCSELREYFPQGIEIRKRGVDPQRLDRDRNGIGCSAND